MGASIEVVCGDALRTECDVLVLKFAQTFRGADLAAAEALGLPVHDFELGPGEHRLVPTGGRLACRNLLFCGVGRLGDFRYEEIRAFSSRALKTLASMGVPQASVAMTMHGAGYGLDERESFSAQAAGLLDYLTTSAPDRSPKRIVIVEQDRDRCQRMQVVLQRILLESRFGLTRKPGAVTPVKLPDAGIRSDAKKHVFVAMPYSTKMGDIYEFGIKGPVHEAGYLCERCDRDIFTGDILDRIKTRITTATVVIADLTDSNPNVYLEVGYAWGKGVPTLLVAQKGEDLKFDVKTQKCVYYASISISASNSWNICPDCGTFPEALISIVQRRFFPMWSFLLADSPPSSLPTSALIYGLAVVIGYLLGSIPFGYFVGRRYGIDIRQHGSGNIGATNILRVLGKKPGYVVFIGDMLKGVLAVVVVLRIAQVLIARAVDHGADLSGIINVTPVGSPEQYLATLRGAATPAGIVAAVACILGHNFPVWLHFRGGKGVATTVGVLLGLMPVSLSISAVVWVTVFYSLRYVSLASLLAAAVLPVSVWFFKVRPAGGNWPLFYFSLLATALIFWRHRSNIGRLLRGTEARFVPSPDPAQPLP